MSVLNTAEVKTPPRMQPTESVTQYLARRQRWYIENPGASRVPKISPPVRPPRPYSTITNLRPRVVLDHKAAEALREPPGKSGSSNATAPTPSSPSDDCRWEDSNYEETRGIKCPSNSPTKISKLSNMHDDYDSIFPMVPQQGRFLAGWPSISPSTTRSIEQRTHPWYSGVLERDHFWASEHHLPTLNYPPYISQPSSPSTSEQSRSLRTRDKHSVPGLFNLPVSVIAPWCFPSTRDPSESNIANSNTLLQDLSYRQSKPDLDPEKTIAANFYQVSDRVTDSDLVSSLVTGAQGSLSGCSTPTYKMHSLNEKLQEMVDEEPVKTRSRRSRLVWMLLTILLVFVATGAIVGGIVTSLTRMH